MALYVLETAPIDGVWLVPTYVHAFGKELAPYDDRVAMCELAAAALGPRASVSRVEEEIAWRSGEPGPSHLAVTHPRNSVDRCRLAGPTSGIAGTGAGGRADRRTRRRDDADGLVTELTMPRVSSTEVRRRVARRGRGGAGGGAVPFISPVEVFTVDDALPQHVRGRRAVATALAGFASRVPVSRGGADAARAAAATAGVRPSPAPAICCSGRGAGDRGSRRARSPGRGPVGSHVLLLLRAIPPPGLRRGRRQGRRDGTPSAGAIADPAPGSWKAPCSGSRATPAGWRHPGGPDPGGTASPSTAPWRTTPPPPSRQTTRGARRPVGLLRDVGVITAGGSWCPPPSQRQRRGLALRPIRRSVPAF
jgi:hypothetical protein